jgi:hypothetical protein
MQRCKAKSKRSGAQCKNFAIREFGVCRMHGAHGGPKTNQGIIKCALAATKHGFYSQAGRSKKDLLRSLLKQSTRK